MRENYKGFTLVELLAIIVILAIIALITTPIILNVIEKSRLNAAKDKAWGTIDAVRIAYATAQTSEQEVGLPYTIKYPKTSASDSSTDSSTGGGTGNGYINNTEVKASGENPTEGTVTISNNGTITASSLKFGNYYCSTINGKGGKLDATKMYCSRTADDVVTPLTPTDLCADNFVVTSGDGIYKDTTEVGRCVYKGDNPNNYIKLGSDLYRIVSVESDGTLKVIKNSSIGSKVFDTANARCSTASTDYCNSTYGCNVWGSKTTMLDSSGNNITQMPREIGGTEYNLPEKEAYINTYLNSTWLNTLSTDVQSKITSHVFNVGLVDWDDSLSNTVTQESSYKWKGKVGLISVSDHIKANKNDSCTSISVSRNVTYNNAGICNNWIKNTWTITPLSALAFNTSYSIFSAFSDGHVNVGSLPYGSNETLPAFYLSSNITLTGEGTSSNPYVVI